MWLHFKLPVWFYMWKFPVRSFVKFSQPIRSEIIRKAAFDHDQQNLKHIFVLGWEMSLNLVFSGMLITFYSITVQNVMLSRWGAEFTLSLHVIFCKSAGEKREQMKVFPPSCEAGFCTYLTTQGLLIYEVLYRSFRQLSSHLFCEKCRFESCILMSYSWFLFEPPHLQALYSQCFRHKNLFTSSTDWIEDGSCEIVWCFPWTTKKEHDCGPQMRHWATPRPSRALSALQQLQYVFFWQSAFDSVHLIETDWPQRPLCSHQVLTLHHFYFQMWWSLYPHNSE